MKGSKMRGQKFVLTMGVITVLCAAYPCAADELDEIIDAWRTRQQNLKTLACELRTQVTVPRGALTEDSGGEAPKSAVPPEDYTYNQKAVVSADFGHGWYRLELWTETFHRSLGHFYPSYSIEAFDGSRYILRAPRQQNTSPLFKPAKYDRDFLYSSRIRWMLPGTLSPVFFGHAILGQTTPLVSTFRDPPERGSYRVHGHATVEGQDCVVLRTTPRGSPLYCELWVAKSLGWSIVRSRSFGGGFSWDASCKVVQHQGEWMTGEWAVTQYLGAKLQERCLGQVTNVSLNTPLARSLFALSPEPGMIVSDDDRLYQIEPDGTKTPVDRSAQRTRSGHSANGFALTITMLVVVAGTVVTFRRIWKRRSGKPASPAA